jgi:nucleotide-binding universal stress UspA family protein
MVWRHILVPLDGSRLAEDVLVPVAELARRFGSRVTLLHVLERDPPDVIHGQHHVTQASEGEAYLQKIADRLTKASVEVEIHVHHRGVTEVATAIDSHAHEYDADLIAMCKHGRSGLRHMLMGSIAQQILRGGSTPMLLRSPREEPDEHPFAPQDILVPLDLQHDVERIIATAAEVARAFSARVHLLTAVPSLRDARRTSVPARLLPGATAATLDMEEDRVHAELQSRSDTLERAGIKTRVVVRHEEPGAAILDEAHAIPAPLVVLGTHARAGFDAWLSGSTGYRVIIAAPQNLLLLRDF